MTDRKGRVDKKELVMARLWKSLNAARRDERGAVSIIFALSFLPVLAMSAAALDYGRAVQTRTKLQGALDSAVLVAARDSANLTDAQLSQRARDFVSANLGTNDSSISLDTINVTRTGKVISITSQANVATAMLGVIGINSIPVTGQAKSTWGDFNIEIALVLDNTGSMASSNKMVELKRALCGDPTCQNTQPSTGFMKIMRDAAGGPDRIKVGMVPFDTTVRMPLSVQNAVNTGFTASTSFFAPTNAGYCTSGSINDNATRISFFRFANRDKDTEAGNYIGWNFVGTGCGANGDPRATPSNWQGCVWDRDVTTNRDTTDGNIDLNDTASLHPAVNCRGNLARIRPLDDIWTNTPALVSALGTMQPSGNTNVTIGAAWGQAILTRAEPFTEAAPLNTASLYRVMILLTDGDNTESKHSSNQTTMDARTRAACANAKSQGITIYSIRVIDGDAPLLRDCASTPGNYYEVSNASQLTPVFQQIAAQIGNIRITN
jgi:Flp pilus assembly protein TadG